MMVVVVVMMAPTPPTMMVVMVVVDDHGIGKLHTAGRGRFAKSRVIDLQRGQRIGNGFEQVAVTCRRG
jgi:hypothetical protein